MADHEFHFSGDWDQAIEMRHFMHKQQTKGLQIFYFNPLLTFYFINVQTFLFENNFKDIIHFIVFKITLYFRKNYL